MRAIRLVLEPVDLDRRSARRAGSSAFIAITTCADEIATSRASSRASGRTLLDLIQPDDRGRRVDRIHHIVEDTGQRVDVFAIERGDEGAMQALDDLVGEEVALVLDFLDLVGLVPDRRSGASISSRSAAPGWICSASATKSSKNRSSRGISLNATNPLLLARADADLEPRNLSRSVSDLTCSSLYRYSLHRTQMRRPTGHFPAVLTI